MHGVERTSTSAQIARQVGFAGLAAAGALLVGCGALSSNGGIEQALTGEATGALEWGPALFRQLLVFDGLALLAVGVWHLRRSRREHPLASLPAPGHNEGTPVAGWEWGLVGGLMILALALRLWRLESCLWLDEVLTAVRFVSPPLGAIVTSFPDENQHMFYSVLAHLSYQVFGESAWSLRLPSVLFGVASIWAVYALGRTIATRAEALLAALLMTVSYHHVWFSQNARGYAGLLFFTLIGTWFFLRGLREGRGWLWIGYAAALALGMWIHLTMLFVATAHGLIYLWLLSRCPAGKNENEFPAFNSSTCWRPGLTFLLAASATLQLYALAMPQLLRSALHQASVPSLWSKPSWFVSETLAGMRVSLPGIVGMLAGGVLLVTGLIGFARSSRVGLALLALPGLLAGLAMLMLQHTPRPRFFFFTLGFLLLIVIRGAMVCGRAVAARLVSREHSAAWRWRLGSAAMLILAGLSATSLWRCYQLPKQDYLAVKTYVESRCKDGDAIVAVGLASLVYKWHYAPAWLTADTGAELSRLRASSPTTWVVYTLPPHMEAYCPDVWEVLQRDFGVVQVFPGTLNGGEIYVCRSRFQVPSNEEL